MSVITSRGTRWLAALVSTAFVLALLVGSNTQQAEAIGPGETEVVYVADGYNFPDALMGATLAALNGAPMLGVRGPNSGDFVPDRTAAELDRLTTNKTNKLDTIYIFGGPAAVSDNVKAELAKWASNVQRISGDDRFGTMEAISKMLPTKAKDADLLDGKDSSAFLGANAKATDSDKLDGKDSTDFLGAAQKAADSDLLDGVSLTQVAPFASAAGGSATTTNSATFEDLPGATVEITVPAGHEAVILAQFTAESACYGDGGYCPVRILIEGTEAQPAVGSDFAFDGDDSGTETAGSWESHAVQRVTGPLPAGTYTVTVQRRVVTGGTQTFRLDDWLLIAEAKFTS